MENNYIAIIKNELGSVIEEIPCSFIESKLNSTIIYGIPPQNATGVNVGYVCEIASIPTDKIITLKPIR